MTKIFLAAALPLALLAGACTDAPAPVPQPDPQQLEILLASLDTAPQPAEGNALEEKIVEADRLAPAIAKVQPEKIDPAVVASLVAR